MISSSPRPFLIRVNKFLPSLLLCYFVPGTVFTCLCVRQMDHDPLYMLTVAACVCWPAGALASAGVISSHQSLLPDVAARYLLPACLVLLTLGTDIPAAAQLGPTVLGCFGVATVSIVVGGPLAFVIVGLWNR